MFEKAAPSEQLSNGERKRAPSCWEFGKKGGGALQNLERETPAGCAPVASAVIQIKLQDSSISFMGTGFS